jgi:homogentisate 1,2-dioxygenase
MSTEGLHYLSGFGNHFATEALPGALPKGQNSPQTCAYGLYAEQLSGTAFTAIPREKNLRSWLYRIRPSVCHSPYTEVSHHSFDVPLSKFIVTPKQLRWDPATLPAPNFQSSSQPSDNVDFLDGFLRICGSGDEESKKGLAIYNYSCNVSMVNRGFQDSDGDLLIVPQHGNLRLVTELGIIQLEPAEVAVIPRGVKFSVHISEPSRGYVLETFAGRHFELPCLGPIGANGLANPRDFETPVAAFEDKKEEFTVMNKFIGKLFQAKMNHSPYNVVAWHGLCEPLFRI